MSNSKLASLTDLILALGKLSTAAIIGGLMAYYMYLQSQEKREMFEGLLQRLTVAEERQIELTEEQTIALKDIRDIYRGD